MKSLQPFQDILNEGGQIEFDENKLKLVRQEVDTFENTIIRSILNELDKNQHLLFAKEMEKNAKSM